MKEPPSVNHADSTPSARAQKGGLGRIAARGAAYSGVSQVVKIVITILSTIVVARILSPSDYGIVAMTAPITGFILLFQNLGLNQAAVQAETVTPHQTNALFFYNMIASLAVALALLLISPLIALFYEDHRPAYLAAASSLTVLITGSAMQHTALLTRQLRFGILSLVDVVSAVAIFLASLLFALLLHNYWAIWLGNLAGAIVNAILVWAINRWRPSWPMMLSTAKSMLNFGANLTGYNLLNYLMRNVDNVLIAKFWGAHDLGLYDRSYRLMMMPIQNINVPLGRVMLPAMARVRSSPERFRRMYVLTVRAISLASVPGVMAAAMCSDRLIPFLLGERWAQASPIFLWLSLAAITQPISNSTGWLFTATGRTREMLRWGLVSAPITIVSFVIGLPWGAEGVAASFFASQAIRLPALYNLSTRNTPVKASDLYGALVPTLAGGGLAWAIVSKIQDHLTTMPLFICAGLLSYGLSTAVQACTRDGRNALVELYRLTRSTFMRGDTKTPPRKEV